MYPTNAKLDAQNFSYKKKDHSLPDDQFEPSLSSISGANYYERESQLLYVVVKGNIAVDIRTAPVIQVKLGERGARLYSQTLLIRIPRGAWKVSVLTRCPY